MPAGWPQEHRPSGQSAPCGPAGPAQLSSEAAEGPSRDVSPQITRSGTSSTSFPDKLSSPQQNSCYLLSSPPERPVNSSFGRSSRKSPIVAETGPRGHVESQEAIRIRMGTQSRSHCPSGPRAQGPTTGAHFQEAAAKSSCSSSGFYLVLCATQQTHWGLLGVPSPVLGPAQMPRTSLLPLASQPVSAGPHLEDPGLVGWPGRTL